MKIRKKLPIESKLTAWRCRVVVLKAAPKEESMVAMEIMPTLVLQVSVCRPSPARRITLQAVE